MANVVEPHRWKGRSTSERTARNEGICRRATRRAPQRQGTTPVAPTLRDVRATDHPRDVERRKRAKLVRFNSDELRIVVDRARTAGRPAACFIREAALGYSPRVRKTELTDSLIRVLSRVATRLGTLSQLATEQQLDGAEDFQRAVNEVLAIIRSLD